MNHVFGYTNFIDGSARGLKPPGNTFYQMKSRDTFAPIGPYIVTADEIKDPNKLQVRLWNNGELKQNFNTDDMAQQDRALHRVRAARSTRWSRATSWRPAPITAACTPSRTATASSSRSRARPACASTCATTSSARWPRDTRLEWENKGGKGDLRPANYRPVRADAGQARPRRSE